IACTETDLPDAVREMGRIYLDQIATLTQVIERLADELEEASKTDDELRRLCTVPGVGPVTAGAIAAFAPDLRTFDSGRNFTASRQRRAFCATLGLVPRQRSTSGKARLGAVSKMGQTDIRKLLIVGALIVGASCRRRACHATSVIRWVVRKGGSPNRWLAALVARKPKMVAAVALANSERCSATGASAPRTARMIWAITVKREDYRMA
ncbi:MAG: transposase, partial [Pseudomonadota bacterium]